MKSEKTGQVYQSKWEIDITKAPSGKDVATIKVIKYEQFNIEQEPACMSKADLTNFIQHLKVLKKKMNNPDEAKIDWPGCR